MKNFENLSSPFMYPIEYRWISAPMKVMNRHIRMLSGSARKPMLTSKLPEGIHVNSVWVS